MRSVAALLTWASAVAAGAAADAGDAASSAAPPQNTPPPPTAPAVAEPRPTSGGFATVSCQDELHCHCTLGNGSVAVQCRYGTQNVLIRWNVLSTRPQPETKFEIDIQTSGSVKVLPSFLDLKLKPPGGQGPSVMFIIRDATHVDALYASNSTFPTEWHLNGVRLKALDAGQLSPAPHPLLLTARHSRLVALLLPPIGAGGRVTLDNCSVLELAGTGAGRRLRPLPKATAARPEVIVRMCRLDTLRTASFLLRDDGVLSPPSLLFDECDIGEMERAAISVAHQSCQLTFTSNVVHLMQRQALSAAGGTLRITNNTFLVTHAAALRGFCGQVSFFDNNIGGPLVYGALQFDTCVHYSQRGNVFQCPCGGVSWLAMFERRQRTSALEVFYERLYRTSFCRTAAGLVPMQEFARLEDCSGERHRSNLVMVIIALTAVVAMLTVVIAFRLCRRQQSPKLQRPRLRRARNLYSSDISAPLRKPAELACRNRADSPGLASSLSALSAGQARPCGRFVTFETDDDDGLYATIVYKKRRAPAPPPASTPTRQRAAPPSLSRCLSEGGIRLPAYSCAEAGAGGGRPDAVSARPGRGIAEESEDLYLVPDGSASVYMQVPTAVYEEIRSGAATDGQEPAAAGVTTRSTRPHTEKTSKDSGIGDDFCPEVSRPTEQPAPASADVYSPVIAQRPPSGTTRKM